MELWLRNNIKINMGSEAATLKESIDGVAYILSTTLTNSKAIEELSLKKGDRISLYDYDYYTGAYIMLFDGVIWNLDTDKKSKKILITGKERTIYIEESEDEYLWSEGQTANQRISIIANDWGIPIGTLTDTKIGLAKGLRKEKLYGMIRKDLKETAQKGGSLYRLRMDEKLDLWELGTNILVPKLETAIEEMKENSTLDGSITQVKVLGKNEKDTTKSPIIGVFKQDTENYGTIQKLVQDDKVDDYAKAQSKANSLFSTGEDSISVKCALDINTLRAGNKVSIYSSEYIVTEITHNFGGKGKMDLNLMTWEGVKTKFYGER
ncbi:hypothetical protein UT300005_05780 [Clostridium sp. CTA-5]